MATYVIGDVQGCFRELAVLLDHLQPGTDDRLWFVGDLVNRGPGSLETLRLVKSLGSQAVSVLGNHDLHFLAIYFGGHSAKRGDTFDALLAAADADELAHWLRTLPLVHLDEALGVTMVHAGIPPFWTPKRAVELAAEVQAVLSGEGYLHFLQNLYGNQPDLWRDDLEGIDRIRLITNYFTRMRLIDGSGALDFQHKEGLENAPAHLTPWYEVFAAVQPKARIVFGHWAAIEGETGYDNIQATDTGCVWGRTLTALCIETGARVVVPAAN